MLHGDGPASSDGNEQLVFAIHFPWSLEASARHFRRPEMPSLWTSESADSPKLTRPHRPNPRYRGPLLLESGRILLERSRKSRLPPRPSFRRPHSEVSDGGPETTARKMMSSLTQSPFDLHVPEKEDKRHAARDTLARERAQER